MKSTWREPLREFFAQRAASVGSRPSFQDLCFVSGRDYRLWQDQTIYNDLVESIVKQGAMTSQSRVLETGCAAGFLAYGVAPRVGRYVGVDIAKPAVLAAQRLGISNAEFRHADGLTLPFSSGEFDAAFCYDVFTNFPDLSTGEPIVSELLRVVKPGGRVLIGSIPDGAKQTAYEARVADFGQELERKFGPPPASPPSGGGLLQRLMPWLPKAEAHIVCYYFDQASFHAMAQRLSAEVVISDVHALNPYKGFRFNAIFTRTRA